MLSNVNNEEFKYLFEQISKVYYLNTLIIIIILLHY